MEKLIVVWGLRGIIMVWSASALTLKWSNSSLFWNTKVSQTITFTWLHIKVTLCSFIQNNMEEDETKWTCSAMFKEGI